MKVLVACEFSQVVTSAFRKLGHEAYSCDLLPTENNPDWHFQQDVFEVINNDSWDLMIAHPPCQYLCSSGLHWNKKRPERVKMTEDALEFVVQLMNADIPKICIENSIGCISTRVRKPDQIIQPWQFGHPESKATCLWLKNLPVLRPTNILTLPATGMWNNQTVSGQNKLGPSPDRWKLRAKTYEGIANAMASQWSSFPSEMFSQSGITESYIDWK